MTNDLIKLWNSSEFVYISPFFFFFFCWEFVWVWIAMKSTMSAAAFKTCGSYALFTGSTSTFLSKFFFKIGSYGIIYTFKNYFAIMFSVFSFQFSIISNIQTDILCIYLDLLIVDLIFNKELKDRRENLKKYKKRSKQPKISFYFFDNQDFLLLLSIYIKRIQKVSYCFFFGQKYP